MVSYCVQFPYITSTDEYQFFEQGTNYQTRSLKNAGVSEKLVLGLSSCQDPEAKSWFLQVVDTNLEQVCWKWGSRSKKVDPFCLYKTQPFLQS